MTWARSSLHVVVALSLCLNMWLGYRMLRLDATLHAVTERPGLRVGSQAPDLDLVTTAGQKVTIRYSDAPLPTVVYIVSPACGWCAKNLHSIEVLAQSLEKRVRFVGVSIPPVGKADVSVPLVPTINHLSFPMYTGLSEAAWKRLRVRSTPATILIAPTGAVLGVWEGAYGGSTKTAIEEYFGVRLPGLGDR